MASSGSDNAWVAGWRATQVAGDGMASVVTSRVRGLGNRSCQAIVRVCQTRFKVWFRS